MHTDAPNSRKSEALDGELQGFMFVIYLPIIQLLGDVALGHGVSDDDGVGALHHGSEVDVGLVSRPLPVGDCADPDEAVHGRALRCRCDELAPLVVPSVRHERVGLALVLARQRVVCKATAQLFGDGLDEEDDNFFGLPLPEVELKGESDEEVDSERASDAHVGECLFAAPCVVLGLGPGSIRLLFGKHFGVIKELVRRGAEHVYFVAVFGLPQLVVGLGCDALGGVILVVGEVGARDVLGVEERRCTKATLGALAKEGGKGGRL